MELTDFMLWKAGIILVVVVIYNFWEGLNGR